MKIKLCLRAAALAVGVLLIAWTACIAAQTTGSVEFSAQVAPTGGRPEPVRQLTFYLLRKSLDDIRTEAGRLEPAPDLGKFVDGLTVSPEMKAMMKKHHSVQLVGEDFTKSLTPDEILNVPELFKAYVSRNAGYKDAGFPTPKFKEKDREANPEKYKQQTDEYMAAIRKFIVAVPESVEGIDLDLSAINPDVKWEHLLSDHRQRMDDRTFELAQQQYMAARADTDLDGHGFFSGLTPGTYWIGMIGIQAISGDVRQSWDIPVIVRAGETTHVELTNLNATKPAPAAQDSNH